MSDILSQEQIDALLNGFDGGGSGSGLSLDTSQASASPDTDKYSVLQSTFELFCQQASTVISTVINKKTTFSLEKCEKANFDTIKNKINSVVLSLKLNFKNGFEGDCFLIIQKKDVALLSDLMMMGDGSAEYSEDHKDAIGELFNQVMGAYTTSLSSEMGIAVSAGSVEVSEFDLDNPTIKPTDFDMLLIPLEIEDAPNSYVTVLVSNTLGDQIVEKSPNSSSTQKSSSGGIGLNTSELDDLSRITSFNSDSSSRASSFSETNIAGVPVNAPRENIDMLLDIDLDVSIELGRSLLSIKRILELAPGSIVELDRMAGEPVDLLVNSKVVARGEVVVIDESFGIRIVSLVSPEERIKSLR
jgi:flagellar motor switch protein FliN/FliY